MSCSITRSSVILSPILKIPVPLPHFGQEEGLCFPGGELPAGSQPLAPGDAPVQGEDHRPIPAGGWDAGLLKQVFQAPLLPLPHRAEPVPRLPGPGRKDAPRPQTSCNYSTVQRVFKERIVNFWGLLPTFPRFFSLKRGPVPRAGPSLPGRLPPRRPREQRASRRKTPPGGTGRPPPPGRERAPPGHKEPPAALQVAALQIPAARLPEIGPQGPQAQALPGVKQERPLQAPREGGPSPAAGGSAPPGSPCPGRGAPPPGGRSPRTEG